MIVIGAKQGNGKVIVKHIDDASAYNLQGFIGKYVEKFVMSPLEKAPAQKSSGLTKEFLAQYGF